MKNNVDLTENQIFSRSNFFQDMALGVSTLSMLAGSKFPWSVGVFREIKSDDEFDLDHQRKSLIAVGDKKQRAEVAEFRKMDGENYCDCCGLRMNLKKPWDKEIGICHKCDKYYEKQDKVKLPWNRKPIGINEIRISVFDFS